MHVQMNGLSPKRISAFLVKRETERVEFKRARNALPDNLWETYSAFCNTDGGYIILGIVEDDDGSCHIEGVAAPHRLITDFWNTANNGEKVSYSIFFNHYVYPVDVKGKTVIVIEVPRAPREVKPVYIGENVFRGTFRRNGEGDYHCTREAVESMIRDKSPQTVDYCIIDDMTVSELDAETVRRYRTRFNLLKEGHSWQYLPDDEFLTKIGAARLDENRVVRPTLAGLLCFGDFVQIAGHLPTYFLDYRERVGGELSFSNPGTFRISKEVAIAGGTSDCRNSLVFNIFSLVNIGERSGMGLSNLFELWRRNGIETPKLVESFEPERITLHVDGSILLQGGDNKVEDNAEGDNKGGGNKLDGGDNKRGNNSTEVEDKVEDKSGVEDKVEDKSTRRSLKDLPASCRQVFRALSDDGALTHPMLAVKLGLSQAGIAKAIAILIKERYIIRQGSRKTGHWEVLP